MVCGGTGLLETLYDTRQNFAIVQVSIILLEDLVEGRLVALNTGDR